MTPRRVPIVPRWLNPLAGLVPADPIARNNAISVLLMGALPAVGGSAIAFLLNAFFIWAVPSLLLRRFAYEMTESDRRLAWGFTAFAAVMLLTAVIAENPIDGLLKCLSFLPFLSLWLVIPRLRASGTVEYLALYSLGAALGSVAAALFALAEISAGQRPEGGAGNAAVFGIMALASAAVAALNINSPNAKLRWLAAAGASSGLIAAGLSLTRGVWISALPILVLILCYAPRQWLRKVVHPVSVTALSVLIILTVWQRDRFAPRFEEAAVAWQQLIEGEALGGKSLGLRLALWHTGGEAFMNAPFLGYGIQNRSEVLNEGIEAAFTHAHNGFLSFAVDGGVLGLAAVIIVLVMPVLIAARADRDPRYRHRLFMALLISLIYAVCGMTQIMFKHDVMDSFYIFSAILVAASVPTSGRGWRRETGAPRPAAA